MSAPVSRHVGTKILRFCCQHRSRFMFSTAVTPSESVSCAETKAVEICSEIALKLPSSTERKSQTGYMQAGNSPHRSLRSGRIPAPVPMLPGQWGCARILLEAGAQTDLCSCNGKHSGGTPLFVASWMILPKLVRFTLQRLFLQNQSSCYKASLLHREVRRQPNIHNKPEFSQPSIDSKPQLLKPLEPIPSFPKQPLNCLVRLLPSAPFRSWTYSCASERTRRRPPTPEALR